MNFLKQICEKRASEARFYRKLRDISALSEDYIPCFKFHRSPTDFVRLLRAIRVESKQISQLGKSLLDPF